MKAFKTTDDSLGMIQLKTGQRVKVTIEGGRKSLEKVDEVLDEILDLVPLGQKILNSIISIFNNISFELPCVLIIDDVEYIKTEQIARGSAVDKIFYQSELVPEGFNSITTYRKYGFQASTIAQARSMARKALREDNWIK